jgi:hypothetical protein
MMLPMREFDWGYELAMYAGTATGVLIIFVVTGGLLLLVRYLLKSSRL